MHAMYDGMAMKTYLLSVNYDEEARGVIDHRPVADVLAVVANAEPFQSACLMLDSLCQPINDRTIRWHCYFSNHLLLWPMNWVKIGSLN